MTASVPQARTTLGKIINLDTATSEDVVETIESRMSLFMSIDRCFSIELGVVKSLMSSQGEELVRGKIMQTIPK